MSCRFNIVSNSTFSIFSAILNNHQNKIVIYPKIWCKNTFIMSPDGVDNIKDIYPNEWIGITIN